MVKICLDDSATRLFPVPPLALLLPGWLKEQGEAPRGPVAHNGLWESLSQDGLATEALPGLEGDKAFLWIIASTIRIVNTGSPQGV